MLNERLASFYEELKAYTRGTDISTPMLVLGHIFLRHAIDTRLGLVLDRNFDLYLQMARNLENPYHLFEKDDLEEFFKAIDEALEKDGYEKISDILSTLSYMTDEKENARFREILGTKSFRTSYADFLLSDFKTGEGLESLLYTLSYQARKDWRNKRSYSLGTLISTSFGIEEESLVEVDAENAELLVSAIAINSNARTIYVTDTLDSRLLAPLSRRNGKIADDEKKTLLVTDKVPANIEEALDKNERIIVFSPSSLLLSSSKENLEKRESLIASRKVEAVAVLPSLNVGESGNLSLLVLTGEDNDNIAFGDLNSLSKDREYVQENQLTEKAMELLGAVIREKKETEEITRIVSYEDVEEKMILVPMNYLEKAAYEEKDTSELEDRIDSLYEKLAALMEL